MIQAFYTAAAGMYAQQKNIDVISNNISNSSTPGYRMKRVEFQELLNTQLGALGEPVSTGYGTKIANISAAPYPEGVNPLRMQATNNGFFVVENDEGFRSYTKNGDFKLREEDGTYYLATAGDEYVLDNNYQRIEMGPVADDAVVAGGVIYPKGDITSEGVIPALVRFDSMEGLSAVRTDHYVPADGTVPDLSNETRVTSYFSEEMTSLTTANQMSEMMKVMQTQMAYQLNSRVLQVVDEMAGMANHLRY